MRQQNENIMLMENFLNQKNLNTQILILKFSKVL